MKILFKNKKIELKVKRLGLFGRFSGLMFKSNETGNLLFEFNHDVNMAIHSFFVSFDFIALWLDEKNRVVEWKIVKPFTVAVKPKKRFRKLIEIPFNNDNSKILRFFVGKERFK
jgi:uncharacterized membrane protein (UPF0127 family)